LGWKLVGIGHSVSISTSTSISISTFTSSCLLIVSSHQSDSIKHLVYPCTHFGGVAGRGRVPSGLLIAHKYCDSRALVIHLYIFIYIYIYIYVSQGGKDGELPIRDAGNLHYANQMAAAICRRN